MALAQGMRLGPYVIESVLGSGGIGEVYRAHDTRLGREVAVKVLRSHLAGEPNRRARFEREARLISSLSHPHICTLHDVGEQDGVDYLVMELLQGQTLDEHLARKRLSLEQALEYGIQIAGALEAAHRVGIIHRDLKPANVMLTKSGAKLLDFGIARAAAPDASGIAGQTATAEGVLVGTLPYMAPEQLEGRDADTRSDLFAFGAVLYEMLTGRRAFAGESHSRIVAAVLESEPTPVSALQPSTPPALEHLVTTCLAKSQDDRWQSAGDLRLQLQGIALASKGTARAVSRESAGAHSWRSTALVTSLAVLVAGSGLAWSVWMRQRAAHPPETRLEISTPPTSIAWSFAISPDGLAVAFIAEQDGVPTLWVRPLTGVDARPLPDTAGALDPFWSPDSRSIGFFADGKLKRIDVDGKAAQTLAVAGEPQGGAWGDDGSIVFAPHQISPLLRVSASGGEAVAVTQLEPGHIGHQYPIFLPDGRHAIYFVSGVPGVRGIYIGRLDRTPPRKLIDTDGSAVYAPTGHVLFTREKALFAQPIDADRGEISGPAVRVADRVMVGRSHGDADVAAVSVSATGVILYRAPIGGTGGQLTWLDRSGKAQKQVGRADTARNGNRTALTVTPDGRKAIIVRRIEARDDLWLVDLDRDGAMTRLTFDGMQAGPLWSPDGTTVTFASGRNGHLDLFRRSIGTGREEALLVTPTHKMPVQWSPDGRVLLYLNADLQTHLDIWALPTDGTRKPYPVVQSPFEDINPQFSPDGLWIAYQSSASGQYEIYVKSFRGEGAAVAISTRGGTQPRWRRDGRELFYLGLDRSMNAVPISWNSNGRSVEAGTPVKLFQAKIGTSGLDALQRQYEVSADGQRFLMDVPIDGPPSPIMAIQNWRP